MHPRLRSAVAALPAVCLAVAAIALAISTARAGMVPRLPFQGAGPEEAGVVSRATLLRIPTYANLALYVGLVALSAGALLAFPWPRRDAPPLATPRWADAPWARRASAAAVLAAIATVVAAVLASPPANLAQPLTDLFHEGEYLGFGPAFAPGGGGFERSFFIHGFGMNVLPALVARWAGGGIPVARAVRFAFLLATWAGCLAVLAVALRGAPGAPAARRARLAAGIAVFALGVGPYVVGERLALHVWGVAAALWLLERAREDRPRRLVVPGVLVGAALALGPLYNYAECLSFALEAAVLALLVRARGPGRLGPALRAVAGGGAATALAVVLAAGVAPYAAAAEQIRYWAATSAAVWYWPLEGGALDLFWWIVAAHVLAIAFLARAVRFRGLRETASVHGDLVLLLAFAALALRSQLGRADIMHMEWAGPPAVLLAVAAGARWIEASWPRRAAAVAVLWAALAVAWATAVLRPGLGDLAAARAWLAGLPRALRTPDAALVPPVVTAAIAAIRPDAERSACFYTLTSEGTYYYLLGRPSCSRFHQLAYARTAAAQGELLRDLERGAPEVILYTTGTGFDAIDGVHFSESHPAVEAWVRANYRPYLTVGPQLFLRRAR